MATTRCGDVVFVVWVRNTTDYARAPEATAIIASAETPGETTNAATEGTRPLDV
jgi:hypothetical protein